MLIAVGVDVKWAFLMCLIHKGVFLGFMKCSGCLSFKGLAFLKIFISLGCAGSSLLRSLPLGAQAGATLVAVHRLLTVLTSLVLEHRL